jgi:hypothetical protein
MNQCQNECAGEDETQKESKWSDNGSAAYRNENQDTKKTLRNEFEVVSLNEQCRVELRRVRQSRGECQC